MAGYFDKVAAEAAAQGLPPPDIPALYVKPKVPSRLAFFWEAFYELSTDRPQTFGGPGPIPWSAIDRFAIRYRLSDDGFVYLLRVIRALDNIWLGEMARRRAADS